MCSVSSTSHTVQGLLRKTTVDVPHGGKVEGGLLLLVSAGCAQRGAPPTGLCVTLSGSGHTHQKQNAQLKGFTGKIQAGLHVTAFTTLPMADKDHDTKGPSFCRHKGPYPSVDTKSKAHPSVNTKGPSFYRHEGTHPSFCTG